MKKLLLIIPFLLICSLAYSDIVAEKIGEDITEEGLIVISTQYIDDKNTLDESDDEQVGAIDRRIWYALDLEGLSKSEIETLLTIDVKDKLKGNTYYQYLKNGGEKYSPKRMLKSEAQVIFDAIKIFDIKIKIKKDKFKSYIDSNKDGLCDEERTISPDGTDVRLAITPQSCK